MPGNGGIRPDHSRRSVPVLTPLHSTSTTASSGPGGERSRLESTRCSGSFKTTAIACISPSRLQASVNVAARECQLIITNCNVNSG